MTSLPVIVPKGGDVVLSQGGDPLGDLGDAVWNLSLEEAWNGGGLVAAAAIDQGQRGGGEEEGVGGAEEGAGRGREERVGGGGRGQNYVVRWHGFFLFGVW